MSPRTGAQRARVGDVPSTTSTLTATTSNEEAGPSEHIHIHSAGTLRLRADSSAATGQEGTRHVQWAQDVVNNEGMGKKSSKGKICCYHSVVRPATEQ